MLCFKKYLKYNCNYMNNNQLLLINLLKINHEIYFNKKEQEFPYKL